jgi:hypothetical protein
VNKPLLSLGLLLAPSIALSAATGAGFLNVPLSPQQLGMGEVSIGGTDILRAWSNPAMLSDQSTRGEISMNGGSFFDAGQSGLGAGAGWRFDSGWSVGAEFSSMSMKFDELDEFGDSTGSSLEQSQSAAGALAALRTGPASWGVALKMVSDSVAGNSASVPAADAGVSVAWNGFIAGAAMRNLGTELRSEKDGAVGGESLPQELRGGLAYRYEPLGLLGGVEYAAAEGQGKIGVGAEWWINKMFALRAGVAGLGATNGQRITAGLSARLAGVGIDYAAGTHTLGLTHQIGVSYGFGGSMAGYEPPPAVEPREQVVEEKKPVVVASKPSSGMLNMAVSDLTPQGVSASDAAVIADMLRSELVKDRRFNVVEKQNMEKILTEQAFQQSGCTSEECAVKIGKLLNVQRMIVGSFGKLMDKYFVNLRVVNVETGAIVFADSAKGRSVEDIESGIVDLCKKIGKQVR